MMSWPLILFSIYESCQYIIGIIRLNKGLSFKNSVLANIESVRFSALYF